MSVTRAVKLPAEDVKPVLEPIVLQLVQATDEAERLASQTWLAQPRTLLASTRKCSSSGGSARPNSMT